MEDGGWRMEDGCWMLDNGRDEIREARLGNLHNCEAISLFRITASKKRCENSVLPQTLRSALIVCGKS